MTALQRKRRFANKEADFKAAGVMGTALTEEQRNHVQERIQASFGEFKRGAKLAAMRGQVLSGVAAKAAGLLDRIGDLSFALYVLRAALSLR